MQMTCSNDSSRSSPPNPAGLHFCMALRYTQHYDTTIPSSDPAQAGQSVPWTQESWPLRPEVSGPPSWRMHIATFFTHIMGQIGWRALTYPTQTPFFGARRGKNRGEDRDQIVRYFLRNPSGACVPAVSLTCYVVGPIGYSHPILRCCSANDDS